MAGSIEEQLSRAQLYANHRGISITGQLGFGHDGAVFASSQRSAIKVHEARRTYERELAVYLRLFERGVEQVAGHFVPQLVAWDDTLLIIEISIVPRPFVLDFASADLDNPPNFPPHIIEERAAYWAELFGDHWETVAAIVSAFERHGIYLHDPHPGNIAFE